VKVKVTVYHITEDTDGQSRYTAVYLFIFGSRWDLMYDAQSS